jgi:molybdate transport system substrate-binding protein
MKKQIKPRIFFALLLSAVVITFSSGYSRAQDKRTLTIFAASSLTDAFKELEAVFEKANPGVDVLFSFGSSSTLATQLKEGAPADIFASANNSQMDVAVTAKRITGTPRTFVKNRLVLAVPADNPAKIASLKDLANPGIKLVLAGPKVPVREYTNTMLNKLVKVDGYGEEYKAAVLKNVVSEEDNVRQVSAKVSLGEADAGIIYRSDITPDISSKVIMLTIPDEVNTIATYPIATISDSANPEIGSAFIGFVLSDASQDILVRWNFISIRAKNPCMIE